MTRIATRSVLPLALLVSVSAIAGCGGGEGLDAGPMQAPDAFVDPAVDAPDPALDAPSAETTRTTIGAAGGTARSADGLFEIIVTAGALTEDTEIAITPVASSAVPADIAATDPISVVYSVEPDGLTFGGDGATVHFHFDETPVELLRDGRYGMAFAASRSATGGEPQWQSDQFTAHHEGAVEVVASLAHLSYQWAVRHDADRNDYYLGVDFDDTHTPSVGDRWNPHIDVQSTTELGEISIERITALGGAVDIESSTFVPSTPILSTLLDYFFDASDGEARSQTTFTGGPFAADRPHVAPTAPRFYCGHEGSGHMVVSAVLSPSMPIRGVTPTFYMGVSDPEPTRCQENDGARVSILDSIPAVREDTAIVTDAMPTTSVRVETRNEGTRTVNLAASPWYVIVEPRGMPIPMGPATITAENAGGATMTATRDASTGEYTALVDDPSLWDPSVSTQVTFGAAPRSEIRPVPPFGVTFGPVSDLDTPMTLEADTRLAIRIPGELRCGVEDVLDLTVFRDIVDSFPLAGPLREGLALLADHCGVAIDALTARPFSVEISRRQRALAVMPDTASVEVGRAITLDGASLLATCGAARPTFCFDRCVDTMADPMNCGGCGLVGTEVCDGVDNDCDYTRDEECPIGIAWSGGGDRDSSGMIGDVTSASFGSYGDSCPYFSPFLGFCGTANGDGTVRAFNAICGDVAWERTGPDVFTLTVTEAPHAGGIFCEGGTFSPSGGMVISARCPAGMIADGVTGMAPSMGHIGQIGATCSRWGVVRHPTHGWVLQRLERGTSTTIGTGAGMPFSFMLADDPVTGAPGALRQLSVRYRSTAPGGMPGGALWFSVAGSPQILDF